MLKRTAVLLLCCYLFSSTEISQILKLPTLIGHYLVHKEKQRDLSLWAFLGIHYFSGEVHDSDYEQDMKLPFKTCAAQGHGEKPLRVEIGQSLIPRDLGRELRQPKLGFYLISEIASTTGAIWQPPKSC
ncbi:hypothetical protein DHW03_03125 [Pedobacter yonginense]|uniref:Uncharacterized protein n=1 Tax=Pedobacter yonginense TaxID=651869 RepID=A0A317EPL9_9SPHI|nr:hypothetical protein [Pedobacter yonginense]PWS28840.1 hypothetical protein DHW03_03125 [Pedobacter yonginense]